MTITETQSATRSELIRRAVDLVPALKVRAAGAEQIRQLPEETVRDMVATGLIRIGNPDRYGGHGIDYDAMFDVGWELGRGCGSTAWCYSVWTVHNWIVGHFPEQAQEDFFADGPDAICSSAFFPGGATAEPMDGGFRVSGRWSFSSGCDAATWAMLGIPAAVRTFILVPRSDYRIVDNWFVSGMCATGSKDIVIEEAFVPSYRVLDTSRAGNGDYTGWELHGRLSYRVPLRWILGWDLVSPLIGMAQGAVDEFTTRLQGTAGPSRTAQSVAIQLRLAEASAEVDAARVLQRSTIQEMLDRAERGERFTDMDRGRYGRNKTYAARMCAQAVNRLFEASGGHALFTSEPIQRFHRDANAASHQAGLSWDDAAEQYGRLVFGLPPNSPRW